jgi:hypothetical protein
MIHFGQPVAPDATDRGAKVAAQAETKRRLTFRSGGPHRWMVDCVVGRLGATLVALAAGGRKALSNR